MEIELTRFEYASEESAMSKNRIINYKGYDVGLQQWNSLKLM